MRGRAFWIGVVVACGVGLCDGPAAAQSAGPPAPYAREEQFSRASPDGTITVEQYVDKTHDDWTWQFWVRRNGVQTRLAAEPAGYPAKFIFTDDLKWIIRAQKLGSGTATLHLYRLTPRGYVRATRTPLGELAWRYMKSRPDWKKLLKAPEYHDSVHLLTRRKDADREPGAVWSADRYLVIVLSGDADVEGRKHLQTTVVNGWRCRYDLQTGRFDVPAVFAEGNAKAIVPADD